MSTRPVQMTTFRISDPRLSIFQHRKQQTEHFFRGIPEYVNLNAFHMYDCSGDGIRFTHGRSGRNTQLYKGASGL